MDKIVKELLEKNEQLEKALKKEKEYGDYWCDTCTKINNLYNDLLGRYISLNNEFKNIKSTLGETS